MAEQRGTVQVVNADRTLATFEDISGRVDSAAGERSLLGIAFDPNFSNNQSVYLYFAVKSGALFINDVGENAWEEINRGASGANYGWPTYEGFATSSPSLQNYRDTLLAYPHLSIDTSAPAMGCAITGGTFYNPATVQFPDYHVGDYFFADLCSGWIRRYDAASHNFATGLTGVVDLEVSEDGELYCLSRDDPTIVDKIG